MWRYTPRKDLLRAQQLARAKGYSFGNRASYEQLWAASEIGYDDWQMLHLLMRYWDRTVYYSSKKRLFIPVNGVLFPAHLFDVTEV